MKNYYIPHKVKPGDILNLSDSDSEILISKGKIEIEDIINVQALSSVYRAQITFIDTASVEVKILELLETGQPQPKDVNQITVIQSISHDTKFNYFLEKATEIGVNNIIPIESRYSLLKKTEALKKNGLWRKIISDAADQSRNPNPPHLYKTIKISDPSLEHSLDNLPGDRICLTTEAVDTVSIQKVLRPDKSFIIAIGPEKGWHSNDHETLDNLGFKKVTMKGNILRTETAALVVASIIKFVNNEV